MSGSQQQSDSTQSSPPPATVLPPGTTAGSGMPVGGMQAVQDAASVPQGGSPPSQSVSQVVAPIVNMITGGNPGNNAAGVQGAQAADNGVFSDIAASVQKVTSQLGAAFQTGKAAAVDGINKGLQAAGIPGTINTSNPSQIAGSVDQLAQAKAAALIASGQAGANIAGMDAMHKAAAATQVAQDAVRMHLDPNSPAAVKTMDAVGGLSEEFANHLKDIQQMKSVGFFDNPASYLYNHIVGLPIAEDATRSLVGDIKGAAEVSTAQTQMLANRGVVDTAMNSVDTVNRAAELYKQTMSAATAAGIEPLQQANQIKISAYNLGVEQENAATNRGRLAIEQAKLPGELSLQSAQQQWYSAGKQATIEQMQATAAMRTQEMKQLQLKNSQEASTLAAVNGVYRSFGQQGNVTDLNRVDPQRKDALFRMAGNLETSGQVGASPAESLELTNRAGIPLSNIPAGQLATLHGINGIYQQELAKATAINPTRQKLTGDALVQEVNNAVTNRVLEEQDRGISSSNLLFQMPNVNTVVGQAWAQNNPVIQAMKPLTLDSTGAPIQRPMDGSLMINTAAQLVQSGKLSAEQAAAALKDAAFHKNPDGTASGILNDIQTAGGFKRFGIPIQEKFPVLYNQSGMRIGSSAAHVDLFNSAQTLNAIRQQVAGMKIQGMASDILTGGGVAP